MRRSRKEGEAGVAPNQNLLKPGISRATNFNWRSKYGGVTVNELKRMKGQAYEVFVGEHQPSIQRACRIVELARTAYHRSLAAPGPDRFRRLPI